MEPIRAKIDIEKGIITKIEPIQKGLQINTEGENVFYPNSWAYPGFSDAHGHIAGLGISLHILNFENTRSAEECAEMAVKKPSFRGDWIFGRGWNHELWRVKELPDLKLLDKYFPDTPCYFLRVDGHSAWINSKAMKICGIDRFTRNPHGGSIMKDNNGNPTGILLDNAMNIAFNKIPKFTSEQLKKMILESIRELKKNGLTHVHDMDLDPGLIPVFKELDDSGLLKININAFIKAQKDQWTKFLNEPYHGNKFHITGLKFYADGALGSRGASLLEPYSDFPGNKGLLLIDKRGFIDKATNGIEKGFHIAIHAIGDNANRLVVNVYEILRVRKIAEENDILRIEHAQILNPVEIDKIAKYNMLCSIQPIHCISDAKMARSRLGSRCVDAYLWKSLLYKRIKIAAGSDFPIESHKPIAGIDAFINRIPTGEETAWYPEEKLSVEEATDAYTINPKEFLGYNKSDFGISVGKKAEITILDNKITDDIGNLSDKIQVLETIC